MKHLAFLAMIGLLMSVRGDMIEGSPINGQRSDDRVDIDANTFAELFESFRGGERACVIVAALSRSSSRLKLDVYDANNNLVASNEESALIAVIWYPPRDGPYTIRVHNNGDTNVTCYIAWK